MSILLPPSPLCVTIPLPLLLLLPADITSCLELEEVLGGGTGGVANLGPSVMSFDRFGFVSKDVSDLVGLLLLLLLLELQPYPRLLLRFLLWCQRLLSDGCAANRLCACVGVRTPDLYRETKIIIQVLLLSIVEGEVSGLILDQ